MSEYQVIFQLAVFFVFYATCVSICTESKSMELNDSASQKNEKRLDDSRSTKNDSSVSISTEEKSNNAQPTKNGSSASIFNEQESNKVSSVQMIHLQTNTNTVYSA